jgi:hypothetical protein
MSTGLARSRIRSIGHQADEIARWSSTDVGSLAARHADVIGVLTAEEAVRSVAGVHQRPILSVVRVALRIR